MFYLNKMSKIKTSIKIVKLLRNYPLWFMNRFGFINKKSISVYKLRNGVKYRLWSYDVHTINHIWNYDVYRKNIIKKGNIIFDIGANVGLYSVLSSRLVGDFGKVFSFEPSPDSFQLLKENIKLNNLKNVIAINKGVSNRKHTKKLFVYPADPKQNSFFKKSKMKNFIKVNCITLKEIIEKNKIKSIDVLKMDCEGAEYEILFSSSDNVIKKIKRVVMEVHNEKGHSINDLKIFLEKKGFKVEMGNSYGDGIRMLYAVNNSILLP